MEIGVSSTPTVSCVSVPAPRVRMSPSAALAVPGPATSTAASANDTASNSRRSHTCTTCPPVLPLPCCITASILSRSTHPAHTRVVRWFALLLCLSASRSSWRRARDPARRPMAGKTPSAMAAVGQVVPPAVQGAVVAERRAPAAMARVAPSGRLGAVAMVAPGAEPVRVAPPAAEPAPGMPRTMHSARWRRCRTSSSARGRWCRRGVLSSMRATPSPRTAARSIRWRPCCPTAMPSCVDSHGLGHRRLENGGQALSPG